jgi:hypothetical protein
VPLQLFLLTETAAFGAASLGAQKAGVTLKLQRERYLKTLFTHTPASK